MLAYVREAPVHTDLNVRTDHLGGAMRGGNVLSHTHRDRTFTRALDGDVISTCVCK